MNDSDKKAFAELMVCNGEIYNKEVSKTLMQTYFTTLKNYSIDDIKNGFATHALDSKHGSFFPKPADIVRHLETSSVNSEDKAMLAWSQVIREIRRTGSYGTLKLDDKQALAAVNALGSWQQLCNSTEQEMTWKKKEFLSVYEVYEKTPIEFLPSSLPGRIELVEHKNESSKSMKNILDGISSHRLANKQG